MNKKILEEARARCRELRKHQTKGETLVWNAVRNRQFMGIKFFRQHPLFVSDEAFYIADFYSREINLVVEIDGKSHQHQKDFDELRTEIIKCFGVNVERFKNEEIERNLTRSLNELEKIITSRTHPVVPL